MIERGSYRLATDALRRLREGHGGAGRPHGRHSNQSAARLARAEEIEAHALDYLYGLTSTDRLARAEPNREQPTTTT
jgi:hypothetical protein